MKDGYRPWMFIFVQLLNSHCHITQLKRDNDKPYLLYFQKQVNLTGIQAFQFIIPSRIFHHLFLTMKCFYYLHLWPILWRTFIFQSFLCQFTFVSENTCDLQCSMPFLYDVTSVFLLNTENWHFFLVVLHLRNIVTSKKKRQTILCLFI